MQIVYENLPVVLCICLSLFLMQRRRWFSSVGLAFIGTLWLVLYPTIKLMHERLPLDSYMEAYNFDIFEALAFLSTISLELSPETLPRMFHTAIFCIVAGAGLYVLLGLGKHRWGLQDRTMALAHAGLAGILLCIGLYISLSPMFRSYSESMEYYEAFLHDLKRWGWPVKTDTSISVCRDFSSSHICHEEQVGTENKELVVIAYIGESTASMHMGLYGYPRDTTPHLDRLSREDDKLLVFNHVFSTHTHTTPSLLEALSLGLDEDESHLPIFERRRVFLSKVLAENGVAVRTVSNQGTGLWNEITDQPVFSNTHGLLPGRNEHVITTSGERYPADHVLFNLHVPGLVKSIPAGEPAVIFFHSYMGHAPYLSNIPTGFRKPVDSSLTAMNPKAVVGNTHLSITTVNAYDSTVKYIDYSVAKALDSVSNSERSIVFVYFPDHGESPYSGQGHNSHEFVHEMARVPFLIYFNGHAKDRYPDLYERYKTLSQAKNIATLAQLPATILDLLGVESAFLSPGGVIGEKQDHSPILVKRYPDGDITYLDLNNANVAATHRRGLGTGIFLQSSKSRGGGGGGVRVCYHRSNTLGKALRGALIADCLEVDLVVGADGELSIYHPPAEDVGFHLQDIMRIAEKQRTALWIDGKNIHSPKACSTLAAFLRSEELDLDKPVLVEFPSASLAHAVDLRNCAQALRQAGVRTSYYVPTKPVKACAEALVSEESARDGIASRDCIALQRDLESATSSGLFSDFSFDIGGLKAMESTPVAHRMRWNTWNVTPTLFEEINPERFGMIIMKNNDPNNR